MANMADENVLAGKKILIVHDEPDVLEVLEDMLSMCEVKKATIFQQARELLETRHFDLAILDIMGVDGYKLLHIAKGKNITTVMLTAHAFSPDNLVKSIKEGADSYIPKEEMKQITAFLVDILKAQKEEKSPWLSWQERLPSSYFEKRWGAAWKGTDKEFWAKFESSLKEKRKA